MRSWGAEREGEEGRAVLRALAVVGTRPEVIKMAPVVRALEEREEAEVVLALTGQHTDLARGALGSFGLAADVDLDLMQPDQSLHDLGRGCLRGLPPLVTDHRPHVLLVQGDTATVFFGALVGFFEGMKVAHVEAGLRSGDRSAPFPEEMLRQLTDRLSDHLFAPTARAAENLRNEGLDPEAIHVTGNTVVDALREVAAREETPTEPRLRGLVEGGEPFVFLTVHRREAFGAPIREIFGAVRELADRIEGIRVLYPVHPNPNVVGPAREILADHPRIDLVEPLSYGDLIGALRSARIVLTDSGGIQEEAPTFSTPVLVLREVTERPEGVDAGVARLVGWNRERIVEEGVRLLTDPEAHAEMAGAENPYGDGRAGERIADILVSAFCGTARRIRDWDRG